ncbi:MAG: RNA polymerase factor sigma-54 [Gemmataceae bacterium]
MSQRLSQQMILAPRMIQSMEILQMPIMDLQERIQQELDANPVLELKEPSTDDVDYEAPPAAERDPGERELVIDDRSNNELDFDRLDALSRDWGDTFNEEHRPSRNGVDEEVDRKHDAMQNMASRPQSLQDYLTDQLGFVDLPADQRQLARHVISHIDDNGFLSVPDEGDPEYQKMLRDPEYRPDRPLRRRVPTFAEIAATFDGEATAEQVEEVFFLVQKLDPPGVGARDLKECLLLQLTPETPHLDLVRKLILEHLADIPHNRLPAIERSTHADLPSVKEAIEVIKRLNPRPGAGFTAESIPYVVPDLQVERGEDGSYDAKLLDDWLPSVYISKRYIELYKDKGSDPKIREYLKRKIQSAQWLQESIEQRRNTLLKVTRAIIHHQKEFLDKGPEHIHPLKMQQIADDVGVHVTTVSRAVDDKWVQTPRGIFPLKRFFGGGKKVGDEEIAYEVMKQKLLEIIDQEDKANPLSDEELVTKMNDAGYPVKRRTITKYRQMAGIPSSRERKDWK